MTAVIEAQPERRQQAQALVDELEKERNQVWALYSRIAELKPFIAGDEEVQTVLTQFAQLMIDYISLGHFGIYQRIIDGKERRVLVLEAAQQMYEEFNSTTDTAVAFNDKYTSTGTDKIDVDLEQDLSKLGEQLAKRIEIEDTICGLILRKKTAKS